MDFGENIEKALNAFELKAKKLPDEITQKIYVIKFLEVARDRYEQGNESEFRLSYLRALKWYDAVKMEKTRQTESGRKRGSVIGGQASKRKKWAELLAVLLVRSGSKFPQAWEQIPTDPNQALPLSEDIGVYRSDNGNLVVPLDLVKDDELPGSLTKSSFNKHYFQRAKKDRDSK